MPVARTLGDSTDVCYDVPLLQSLHAMLRTDVVREQVMFLAQSYVDVLFNIAGVEFTFCPW